MKRFIFIGSLAFLISLAIAWLVMYYVAMLIGDIFGHLSPYDFHGWVK
jgi:hypothetical protein